MGFAVGTAITDNDDLKKYVFEQAITNLLKPGVDFANLHIGAVDTLIAEFLRPSGYVTTAQLAAISTVDFKPALANWVAARIFAGMGGRRQGEREEALSKAAYYENQYRRLRDAVLIDGGDSTYKAKRSLPIAFNTDGGSRFPALGVDRPAQSGTGDIDGIEDLMVEG